MNRKKIIISILVVALVPLSASLLYLKTKNTASISTISKVTTDATNKEVVSVKEVPKDRVSVANDTQSKKIESNKIENQKGVGSTKVEVKKSVIVKNDIKFSSDTLNREDINGYYKVTRKKGGYSYAKMSDKGLADFVDGSHGIYLDFFKFTPITKGSAKTFEYKLDGAVDFGRFTIIDNTHMTAVQPSFNGDEGTMTYTRISKDEYDKEVSKFMQDNDKFTSLGDYYFGNNGYVGTMSTVEKTINIDGQEYKIIKSNRANKKVIASLYGQTYNYNVYAATGKLTEDSGSLYSGN